MIWQEPRSVAEIPKITRNIPKITSSCNQNLTSCFELCLRRALERELLPFDVSGITHVPVMHDHTLLNWDRGGSRQRKHGEQQN